MRYLISGGSGFLGSLLSRELLTAGHQVAVLTRNRSLRPPADSSPDLRSVVWDGRTAEPWWRQVDDCEVWVHLAGDNIGSGRWTRTKKQRLRSSRLESGAALVEAADRLGRPPRVFVQASAVGYYGSCGDRVVNEASPAGSGFLADLAERWERSTAALAERGSRRVVLRTGVVLSTASGALPRLALPFRLFGGGPLGSGRQWVPWIHERDQIRAMRFLIDREDCQGAFNLSAPGPVTQAALARALGHALRRPSFFRVPEALLRLALGEMSAVVLEGQRALPERLLQAGFHFDYPELQAALSNLLGVER